MMYQLLQQRRSIFVYGAAFLFFIHLITYFLPSIRDATVSSSWIVAELNALLGVAEHLLLFPVIATLPAPRWGRAAGYGWLVIDMATEIMQLNGATKIVYLTLRYGGHIAAALWTASASWQLKGAFRIIGVLYAVDLVIYSFVAFVPLSFLILLPSLIFLPVWLVLVGRVIAQPNEKEQLQQGDAESLLPEI
ncbi:hypothetical protein [Ktedonospora formicarum]|uniref:Uncharacterized protein n=1 Tax=Ktedonospora formicarum TaxID=2778364 RepID=A0A8J3I8G8_9CHLR|nr:hypothetical protein [Ktedonospora formicarum]GHO47718.1 hypothetical protein KSX_58810 [Ktedonospora formicarum]